MSTDITASISYNPSPIVSAKTTPAIQAAPVSTTVAAAAPTAVSAPHPSPVSLLDPSTGLVVLQFYNAQGTETQSLPTKKQLDSYRLHEPANNIYQRVIHDDATPLPAIGASAADTGQNSATNNQGP